jgi:hypothetical protein
MMQCGALFAMINFYSALAVCVLSLHMAFILWVIFGVIAARKRLWLRWLHIVSLVWAILIEVFPWTCPLTFLENWLESKAGVQPYQGGFLLHYLDALVYPNVSPMLLTVAAVAICGFNLAVYAGFFLTGMKSRQR